MPKLTIGIPTHHDFSGAIFTIQALRLYQDLSECEIVVIDNTVDDNYAMALERQTRSMKEVRYVRFKQQHGPAIAKNQVFENARGDYVMCIDSHVMLPPGAIVRLIQWFDDHPNNDLVTGPLLMNNGNLSTHFREQWRGEMWGVWDYDPQVESNEPFEVWANGCGLFACRADAWLGFHPDFRGFGAEEGYLHEKFRKNGGKVLCLPWLQWWHRFDNPEPRNHAVTRYAKVRNYVLGFQELERDLEEIYNHFVATDIADEELASHLIGEHSVSPNEVNGRPPEQLRAAHQRHKLPLEQWEYLMENPVEHMDPKNDDVTRFYNVFLQDSEDDLNQHFETLKNYAEQSGSIVEVTRRQRSCVPLLAGRPKELTSLIYEQAPLPLNDIPYSERTTQVVASFESVEELPEADMLFVKFPHDVKSAAILERLNLWSKTTSRFIAFHDAAIGYLETVNDAVKEFVESSDWFVVHYDHVQWGLVVLGRQPQDRPERPIYGWPPGFGPGTELKKLLKEMGIEASSRCACNARALQMDQWGVEGCEENFEQVVDWLQTGSDRWIAEVIQDGDEEKRVTWTDKIKKKLQIATSAITSGLAFKLNPLKPYDSLVRESIRRAKLENAKSENDE